MKVTQSCPTLCDPMDYTVHGILQARILDWVALPFSRGSSHPRIKPRSPALQVDSLPAEPQGKTKNIGVGSLSLLQQIFPTQESNWGLLHCRWILYQLSYQGSPWSEKALDKWCCYAQSLVRSLRLHSNEIASTVFFLPYTWSHLTMPIIYTKFLQLKTLFYISLHSKIPCIYHTSFFSLTVIKSHNWLSSREHALPISRYSLLTLRVLVSGVKLLGRMQ